ncbi:hypothetical protein KAT95_01640 [Candidatus Parcubacteria bacterium]|nr:hypothetical protein [Candidatus Parcubacteria bacterium]
MNDIYNIISYLTSAESRETLLVFRNGFFLFSFFFVIIIIILFLRTNWKKYAFLEDTVHFFTFRPYGAKKFTKSWQRISKKLKTREEPEYKLAIIEADTTLDDILEEVGYKGEKFEDKIDKVSPVVISNKEEILEAHKIRNSIVYNPNYKVEFEEAERILEIYKKALSDLGIL